MACSAAPLPTDELKMFVSVVTLGEIQKGIAKLDGGPKKEALERFECQPELATGDYRLIQVPV